LPRRRQLPAGLVECGGFDLTDVWAVDTAIAVDMVQDTNYPHCFGRPPGDG
jgi:hypothetical protein